MKRISSLILIALTVTCIETAFAKEKECCWIDVKTGKQVPTVPLSGVNISGESKYEGGGKTFDPGTAIISADRRTAHNTRTGQNYALEPDGCWIDVKTGKKVASVPLSGVNIGGESKYEGGGKTFDPGTAIISSDLRTAHNTRTGQNYALEACPPSHTAQAADTEHHRQSHKCSKNNRQFG